MPHGYGEEGQGYFRPHRDNLNPQAAHRRLVLTINRNTGTYTGGDLRFPEYGGIACSPPAGGAVVFSCALAHEVTDVTQGRRYALLTFLSD